MTPEALRTLAREIAKPENKPVFDAVVEYSRRIYLNSMRNSVHAGNLNEASYFDGYIKGVEDFYYAMRTGIAKEG